MLFRFCLYGFLKNQRYFEPFLLLVFLDRGISFFAIGLLIACRDLTVNLIEVPSGAIADSFGRRRAMMVSFVAYICSFLVLGSFGQFWILLLGMMLYGVGDTFRTGTHKAMIFEWLRMNGRSDEKTKVYGITRSWSQIGSAVSGIVAAAFILLAGNYQYVFYFAIIPYALNLVNFAGYPKALDGEHEKARTIGESFRRMKASLAKSISDSRLRRLMAESMGWEGFFAAVKDYLQPVLQALALLMFASWFVGTENVGAVNVGAENEGWWNETRQTALLIGPIYAILFLMSAWASRRSHRVAEWSGGEGPAARRLWLVTLLVYLVLAAAAWMSGTWVVVAAFIVLHVLKNVWRPILISRFDNAAAAHEGATVLSIESQSQRAATFVMAPLIGWLVDRTIVDGGEAVVVSDFWPIGVIGALVAAGMLVMSKGDR